MAEAMGLSPQGKAGDPAAREAIWSQLQLWVIRNGLTGSREPGRNSLYKQSGQEWAMRLLLLMLPGDAFCWRGF